MTMDYTSPTSGPGGDGDQDDAAGMDLWALEGSPGIWTPECWHKSPEQLQDEARAMNESAFASAASGATRHSDAPLPPSHERGI